jgi:hypothetical protein
MWPLGHVGHVTYSFINMLFISTGIFYDKLRPQIGFVATHYRKCPFKHDSQNQLRSPMLAGRAGLKPQMNQLLPIVPRAEIF